MVPSRYICHNGTRRRLPTVRREHKPPATPGGDSYF